MSFFAKARSKSIGSLPFSFEMNEKCFFFMLEDLRLRLSLRSYSVVGLITNDSVLGSRYRAESPILAR